MNRLSEHKTYKKISTALAAAFMGLFLSGAAFAAVLSSSQQALLQQSAANVKSVRPAMSPTAAAVKKSAPAKWTVLVYMNGNSNLSPDVLRIVNEMEAAGGSSSDVQMVAYMSRDPKYLKDSNPMYHTQSPYGIWTPDDTRGGSELYHVTGDKHPMVTSFIVPFPGDPGKPATLKDFIVWGKQAYPAQRYLLMIYGHGSGMLGTSASDAAGGGSSISIPDLSDVLRLTGGVDVLFFYSCLMQMAEVSARLDGVAGVVIGSETSMLSGLPFEPMFKAVRGAASADAEQMAGVVFEKVAENDTRLESAETAQEFALSAIKPGGSKKMVKALDAYVSAVMKEQDLESASFARDHAVRVFASPKGEAYFYDDYCDLGSFVQLQASKSKSPAVQAAAQAFMDVMYKDYVLQLGQTGMGSEPTGVSIYLPAKGSKMLPPDAYNGNPIGGSKWGGFIRWLNMERGDSK